ncbi:MAG TPA: hypothetical protein DCK83_08635 [Gallionellaceae bacterium]|nr:hypothetical protein [Gallionellaceae bacterium]
MDGTQVAPLDRIADRRYRVLAVGVLGEGIVPARERRPARERPAAGHCLIKGIPESQVPPADVLILQSRCGNPALDVLLIRRRHGDERIVPEVRPPVLELPVGQEPRRVLGPNLRVELAPVGVV